jgi:amidohydrolase
MVIERHDELLDAIMTSLRRTLHRCPEISGKERVTSTIIENFVLAYRPDAFYKNLGGHGVAAVFAGPRPGPTVLVRCELDALAIEEDAGLGPFADAGHRCGHDGHMAIVAGLAPVLFDARPATGRVVLLFQPAEETGAGALRVVQDPQFSNIRPDYALALHNLPGVPENTVVARRGVFAGASVGMCLVLTGRASHAAEPEHGLSPAPAMTQLLQEFERLNARAFGEPFRLMTITHVEIGRRSFGLTPGSGELRATLRAEDEVTLSKLRYLVDQSIRAHCEPVGLEVDLDWVEQFPETRSDDRLVAVLEEACEAEHVDFQVAAEPFRWSEDFGHFSKTSRCLYFGLGVGKDRPPIHSRDYAFPDSCISIGSRLFHRMAQRLTDEP